MKNLFCQILLLFLLCSLLQAQNINVDSLQRDVDEYTKEDTTRVNKLLALAMVMPNNQKERTEAIYLQAEKLASKIGWKKGEANALISISGFYSGQKQFDKGISAGLKAGDIATALNDSSLMSFIAIDMGDSYRYMGDLKKAEVYALKGLETARAIKNQQLILKAFQLLVQLYSENGHWDKVHLYADSVMKLATLLNDVRAKGNMLYLFAAEQTEKQNYAEANEYYLQALQVEKREKNQVMITYTYSRLSIGYSSMKRIDSALYYAKLSLDLAFQNKFDPDVSYAAYYRAYDAAQDYKNALKYYLLYDSCLKSSYNMEAGQNAADVVAKSEQEKKDALANAAIKRQQLIRNGSLLVAAIVALFALVFLRQRNNTKKEKLRAENALTELKLAQEQLVKQEKAAAFGSMATRMAHEIQNPLNFVNNFSELSVELVDEIFSSKTEEEKIDAATVLKENLEKINQHGKRASEIIKQLQEHSNKGTTHEYFEAPKPPKEA